MTIIDITCFDVDQLNSDEILKQLEAAEHSQNVAVGTQIAQDSSKSTIQITSALNETQSHADFESHQGPRSLMDVAQKLLGEPRTHTRVELLQAAFGPEGPANAEVVEYAESWFPASDMTPEFRRRIEEDFAKFDDIFTQESNGNSGLAFGWGVKEQDHKDIEGRRARNFVIVRGWNNFDDFKKSVDTDAYRRAIPILFQWKAPFQMWHVERDFP